MLKGIINIYNYREYIRNEKTVINNRLAHDFFKNYIDLSYASIVDIENVIIY